MSRFSLAVLMTSPTQFDGPLVFQDQSSGGNKVHYLVTDQALFSMDCDVFLLCTGFIKLLAMLYILNRVVYGRPEQARAGS